MFFSRKARRMKMNGMVRWFGVCALVLTLGLWGVGCEQDAGDHMEDAGDSLQDAGESVFDAAEQAGEDAGEAAEEAGDAVEEELDY